MSALRPKADIRAATGVFPGAIADMAAPITMSALAPKADIGRPGMRVRLAGVDVVRGRQAYSVALCVFGLPFLVRHRLVANSVADFLDRVVSVDRS